MNIKVAAAVGMVLLGAMSWAEEPVAFKDQKEKVSYALGADIAKNLKRQAIEIDGDIFARGLKDVLSGGKMALTDEDLQSTLMAFQQELRAKQAEAAKKAAEKNKAEGEAFLAANKAKEGVVVLPSGLQYKVEKQGEGAKPTPEDTVECHYRGTLIDGTEFDSSLKRGQPATFPVKGVIKGWTEALQLMPVGSKWQLFVPSNLGYGERGAGANIGPNATLIFEVELLAVKEKEKTKAPHAMPPMPSAKPQVKAPEMKQPEKQEEKK